MPETSISFAIVLFGILVVSGLFFAVGTNSLEQVREAQADQLESDRIQRRTAVNVTRAVWDEGDPLLSGDEHLDVFVNNTGTTTLSVNATDLLVEGKYVAYDSSNVTTTVDGRDTDVWPPGTQLHVRVGDEVLEDLLDVSLTGSDGPDRIKFVAGPGVAEWKRVS